MEERKKREKLCGAAVERGVSFAGTDAVERVTDPARKDAVASEILAGLPEWFGLPESTKEYIEGCRSLPFWRCQSKGRTVGFLALKETSPYTAEIFVMGVCREFHGAGAGRALVLAAERYALGQGYEFLQVKTVQKGHYAEYDSTNAFYERMGFRELECFPMLWDAWNPCQVYVKAVDGGAECMQK